MGFKIYFKNSYNLILIHHSSYFYVTCNLIVVIIVLTFYKFSNKSIIHCFTQFYHIVYFLSLNNDTRNFLIKSRDLAINTVKIMILSRYHIWLVWSIIHHRDTAFLHRPKPSPLPLAIPHRFPPFYTVWGVKLN